MSPDPNLPLEPTPSQPIADLSYRHFDGPLHNRTLRWWTITLAMIRLTLRKPGFWILVALAMLPHLIRGFQIYLQSQVPQAAPDLTGASGSRFAPLFFQAFDGQKFFFFLIALQAGAGTIAADNRANALLVYLSKPITKGDYLLGKWMSVFLTLTAVALVPALLLYLYCLLSYSSNGFLHREPWLLVQLIGASLVPGILHSSLIVGLSAWSKSPRMAGAAYAGLYLVSSIVAVTVWGIRYRGDLARGVLERHLSIDGVIGGLAQNCYQVTLKVPQFSRRSMEFQLTEIAIPDLWPLLLLGATLTVLGLAAARARIHAVEVVRG
ncbi:MAG: ABC transporter permease subunit [Chloroherpetonaceae bacterium]|nr:ABC transporter permease [Chthonomonadaceae bacterium]MDW8207031.1 ABC transporter permease subunit [Chloroherpetonaceae bacterium]